MSLQPRDSDNLDFAAEREYLAEQDYNEMADAFDDMDGDYDYPESDYDGQPDEYTEWQDYYGGDDWDHGQYDEYGGEC